MLKDRFQLLLRYIRFYNKVTRNERSKSDKAAAIRDVWTMMDRNLSKGYKPSAAVIVDEQLFPFRGRTQFTQYMTNKPAKYGIKIFWCCCCETAYPLRSMIYLRKQPDKERQQNVGAKVVLDLVGTYKGSGRNVTTDNFFTSLKLAETLRSWNLTLVGTVSRAI